MKEIVIKKKETSISELEDPLGIRIEKIVGLPAETSKEIYDS
jgi:hypothetical protein